MHYFSPEQPTERPHTRARTHTSPTSNKGNATGEHTQADVEQKASTLD